MTALPPSLTSIRQQFLDAETPPGEIFLAETAIRIELPPSLHERAVERYEAIRNWMERDGSPLAGRIAWFYPQGSMAIGATIKSHRHNGDYDIDVMAELMVPVDMPPASVRDLTFTSIRGEPGSRYYDKTELQTRCATVHFDGMHLDVTSSRLLDASDPRRSVIFHAKPGEPASMHREVETNSWAFCDWFNANVPRNLYFENAYARRVRAMDAHVAFADADFKPVPEHTTLAGGKPAPVIALQLLKRNRNVKYEARPSRRSPPSVMLATEAGQTPCPADSISGSLKNIARALLHRLTEAEMQGKLVDIRNPRCPGDCFTDRWPENRAAQCLYIEDLRLFLAQLEALMDPGLSLDAKRDLLIEMFGEGPARATVDAYTAALMRGVRNGSRSHMPSGRVVVASAAAALPAQAIAARPRTFYGTRWSGS